MALAFRHTRPVLRCVPVPIELQVRIGDPSNDGFNLKCPRNCSLNPSFCSEHKHQFSHTVGSSDTSSVSVQLHALTAQLSLFCHHSLNQPAERIEPDNPLNPGADPGTKAPEPQGTMASGLRGGSRFNRPAFDPSDLGGGGDLVSICLLRGRRESCRGAANTSKQNSP